MSESAIRTAVYNAVNGVSNIGLVYDYERHATDWSTFLDLFKTTISSTDQIRGWMVGYRGISEADGRRFSGSGRITRTHQFQILGVMGLDDSASSEKTFAALAEDVCDALDSDSTLHGGSYYGSPATLAFDPAPFAGVLVHAAVITFQVMEVA